MPGPDINGFYDMLYGTAGVDWLALSWLQSGGASGMVFCGNPSFALTDFASVYPKFFGPTLSIPTGVVTQNSNQITGVPTDIIPQVAVGQLLSSSLFPLDTLITAASGTAITVSNNATVSGTGILVYNQPFVPLIVISTFITLALASVMQARYQDSWFLCMCLYVAHFVTMYMRTESGPNSTASQVAASGLTKGILVHRGAGDVSASSQLVQGYEQWGAFQETEYGVQFITFARAIGMGPIWVP